MLSKTSDLLKMALTTSDPMGPAFIETGAVGYAPRV
jgi:hypothetical protein